MYPQIVHWYLFAMKATFLYCQSSLFEYKHLLCIRAAIGKSWNNNDFNKYLDSRCLNGRHRIKERRQVQMQDLSHDIWVEGRAEVSYDGGAQQRVICLTAEELRDNRRLATQAKIYSHWWGWPALLFLFSAFFRLCWPIQAIIVESGFIYQAVCIISYHIISYPDLKRNMTAISEETRQCLDYDVK